MTADRIAELEAAPDAPESQRDRVAAALFAAQQAHDGDFYRVEWKHNHAREQWYALADAALAVRLTPAGDTAAAVALEEVAAAQEASASRWAEAVGEADNDTDRGYAAGRAHATEQAALRIRAALAQPAPAWPRGVWSPPPPGWPHRDDCPVTHAARSLANGSTAGTVGCHCPALAQPATDETGLCHCDADIMLPHARPCAVADVRRCESGCGCRYGTNDPDRLDCGCDGPCTMLEDEAWGTPHD